MTSLGALVLDVAGGNLDSFEILRDALREQERNVDLKILNRAFGKLLVLFLHMRKGALSKYEEQTIMGSVDMHSQDIENLRKLLQQTPIQRGELLTLPEGATVTYPEDGDYKYNEFKLMWAYERFIETLYEMFWEEIIPLVPAIRVIDYMYPEEERKKQCSKDLENFFS